MVLPLPAFVSADDLKTAALVAVRNVLNEHNRCRALMRELATAGRLAIHLSRHPIIRRLEDEENILTEPEYATSGLHGDPKRAVLEDNHAEEGVRPDVIVHKRGIEGPNCMVIEVKMGDWRSRPRRVQQRDQWKIEALTSAGRFEYALGLWFALPKRPDGPGYYAEFRGGAQVGPIVPIP
ncbi:MAG: hypothetical protein GEV13_05530 [Rhodospirillales bacterium]|nr:hypothetical protein [Rhodospirillales bacterium]